MMDLGVHTLTVVQAVSDLRAVAAEPSLPIPVMIKALGADSVERYRVARLTAPLAPAREGGPITDALSLAVASPEEDPVGAAVATATLLAHAIETGDAGDDWLWAWEAVAPSLRRTTAPVRAALMNGFRRARTLGLASDEIRPSDDECITMSRQAVIEDLLTVARSMTSDDREEIAAFDYGHDVQRHLDALNAILADPECRRNAGGDDTWFPSEVVELAAYEEGPWFGPSTALVLIWTLQDEDYAHGFVGGRWSRHHRRYGALPSGMRGPILQGFRHCYEARASFDEVGADGHVHLEKTLPWLID
ncbi:MAG: hypothetical protein AAF844_21265 [Pseudomonadota bacterium]